MLTESETEYVVKCIKHIFAEHVLFEFSITNTLNDQILENAQVVMEGGEQEIDAEDVVIVPCAKIGCDETASAFVAFPFDTSIGMCIFSVIFQRLITLINTREYI